MTFFPGTTITVPNNNRLSYASYLLSGFNQEAQNPNTSSTIGTSNKALYIPIIPKLPLRCTQMWIAISSNASGNNIDMGIYDSLGNRLSSTGSSSVANAAAIVDIALTADVYLDQGNFYYLGVAANGTSLTWAPFIQITLANIGQYNASGVQEQTTAFPLPNPMAPIAPVAALNFPWFGVKAFAA